MNGCLEWRRWVRIHPPQKLSRCLPNLVPTTEDFCVLLIQHIRMPNPLSLSSLSAAPHHPWMRIGMKGPLLQQQQREQQLP